MIVTFDKIQSTSHSLTSSMAPTNVLRNLRKLMTQKCMKILGTSKKQFNKRKRTKLLLGFLKATKLFRWKLVTEKRMHRGLKL